MNIWFILSRLVVLFSMLTVASAVNAGIWDYFAAFQLQYSDNMELIAEDGSSEVRKECNPSSAHVSH